MGSVTLWHTTDRSPSQLKSSGIDLKLANGLTKMIHLSSTPPPKHPRSSKAILRAIQAFVDSECPGGRCGSGEILGGIDQSKTCLLRPQGWITKQCLWIKGWGLQKTNQFNPKQYFPSNLNYLCGSLWSSVSLKDCHPCATQPYKVSLFTKAENRIKNEIPSGIRHSGASFGAPGSNILSVNNGTSVFNTSQ